MLVSTKDAARLLDISPKRMRTLIAQGRVEGAVKIGGTWVVPLFEGKVVVKLAKRGLKPTWINKVGQPDQKKVNKRPKKIVKVLQANIKSNQGGEGTAPVISVVKCGDKAHHVHEINIQGQAKLCYSRLPRKDKGGASVWLETNELIEMFMIDFDTNNRIYVGCA